MTLMATEQNVNVQPWKCKNVKVEDVETRGGHGEEDWGKALGGGGRRLSPSYKTRSKSSVSIVEKEIKV